LRETVEERRLRLATAGPADPENIPDALDLLEVRREQLEYLFRHDVAEPLELPDRFLERFLLVSSE